MGFKLLDATRRNLTRSAAIFVIGAVSAGCSSGVTRFQDDIFTGSTDNQRQIISKADRQPYPGDTMQPAAGKTYVGSVSRNAVQPVNLTSSASVQRSGLAPVAGTQQTPVSSAHQRAAALAPAKTDPAPSGTTAKPKPATGNAGGTSGAEVTVKPGETVYGLSRRYGVPANAIMAANGLSDGNALQAGKKIVIPTYAYSNKTPVSAPGHDTKVADTKPKTGTLGALPADKLPEPARPADRNVAVLPQTPKLKEPETAPKQAANAPANAKPQSSSSTYTVVAGDTLFGIARKTGASAEAIKQSNGMSSGIIRVGQVLTIPSAADAAPQVATAATSPKVDAVTTGTAKQAADAKVEPAAYTPPKKHESIITQSALDPEEAAPDATGIGRMRWPVRGRVIADYGASGGAKANDGIDIAVPSGTPVKAAENGVVIYAGDGLKEFGNTVLVRHEDGLVTVYGHADELKVARGEKVRRGQEIARSGMSGSAETPKLHFEVRRDSVPVDPKTYLE